MNNKAIIDYLTNRFPNRNWNEIVWRYQNNEPIQIAQKIAVEKAMSEIQE